MPALIRPFRRGDRDQLTRLVNAHAAAVLPGASASVNTVMGQLEREPGEFVVDPWVADRTALVAEQAGSVVAAALLHRHGDGDDVGATYRGTGEVRWLVFWPTAPEGNPHWHDGRAAATALMGSCLQQMRRWGVREVHADGALPVLGVYGVPQQWPHVERLYRDSGFACPQDAVEVVHLIDLNDVPDPGGPPLPGMVLRRSVGTSGTRLAAWLGQACLGSVDRLLHYASADDEASIAFVEHHGTEITRTRRGWTSVLG